MQLKTMISTIATVAIYLLAGQATTGEQAQPPTTSNTIDSFIMQRMDETLSRASAPPSSSTRKLCG
jgi:hypothetical protein